ncbi:MAG: formylglycine-generating enzyme family protein [Pseudomonadota bacterium]
MMVRQYGAVLPAIMFTACQQAPDDGQVAARCTNAEELAKVVPVKGGPFTFGADPVYAEEGPPETVIVSDFRIDAYEVTNAQFADFVEATGYKTDAETIPASIDQLPAEMREPGSAVFVAPDDNNPNWWHWQPGASWKQPEGPGSSLKGRESHPVVHMSHADALAYAQWKGGRLPSEAEWEFAARAGSTGSQPPTNAEGLIEANHYQGAFPARDLGEDGFIGTAPVGCFEANAFGVYDMIGNVWEWTDKGPDMVSATIKGGSYLCADNYCRRYRPSARQFQERDLGTSHIGFRVAYDAR